MSEWWPILIGALLAAIVYYFGHSALGSLATSIVFGIGVMAGIRSGRARTKL